MRLLGLGLAVVAASCISGGPPDLQVAGVHAALQTVSPGELLDRVDYTARACVGQSIHVKVTPATAGEPVDVYVQGRPGTNQWMQLYGDLGLRQVQVYAQTPSGQSQFIELSIQLLSCKDTWPRLQVALDTEHDRMVDFVVANAQAIGEGVLYHWTFGDGSSVDTDVPAVRHTYAVDAIDWHVPDTAFQATVQVVGLSAVGRKTVVYHHEYARMLARGIVQPPLEYDVAGHTGDYTIHNVEDEAMELEHTTSTWQPCLPGGELLPGPEGAADVSVSGHGEFSGRIDLSGAPVGACGMEVRLTGHMKSSEQLVDVPLYFEAHESSARIQPVTDPGVVHMLEQADAAGLLPADGTSVGDLQEFAREGRLDFVYPTPLVGDTGSGGSVVPLIADRRCNPHDTTPPPFVDYQCLPTGDYEEVLPYVANAHSGDIALSAGCGLIGSLLRNVTPAQRYSHTGIFVRDFDMIRNATASQDWLEDDSTSVSHLSGHDGVKSRYMRHMWPGLISETVNEAYYGHLLRSNHPDDHNPQLYPLRTFNSDPVTCEGDGTVQTWAELLRPLPVELGNPREQAILDRNNARATAGRVAYMGGHYRLFAYTKGMIGTDDFYDWPEGWRGLDDKNRGLVCSSTIWTATRVDNRSPGDMAGTIPVHPEFSDCDVEGLNFYDEAERLAGAQLVHDRISQAVHDYHFGSAVAGAPDDFADQITNCFASDACDQVDGDDHNEWATPGTGCAVSPDDMIGWIDTWGYHENLAFREGRMRPVYMWQSPVDGHGDVLVTVVNTDGAPVIYAETTLGVGDALGISDALGHVMFENVPGGHQVARAQSWIPNPDPTQDPILITGETPFDLADGGSVEVTVVLGLNNQSGVLHREQLIKVEYHAVVHDDEWGADEEKTQDGLAYARLDTTHPVEEIELSTCAGDEAILRVTLRLQLSDGGTVVASTSSTFSEGWSCATTDVEDRWSDATEVYDSTRKDLTHDFSNSGVMGGDWARLQLHIYNDHPYTP